MTFYDDEFAALDERATARMAAREEIATLTGLVAVLPLVVVAPVGANKVSVAETVGGPVVGVVYLYNHVGVVLAGQTVDVLIVGGRPRAVLGRVTPDPVPVEPVIEPLPGDPIPVEPTPVEPTPIEPTPIEPTPVEPAPAEPTPIEPTPVEPTPVEPVPTRPLITLQAQNVSVVEGAVAVLTATATDWVTTPSYWEVYDGFWAAASGTALYREGDTLVYKTNPVGSFHQGRQYRPVFVNAAGTTRGTAATVTVTTPAPTPGTDSPALLQKVYFDSQALGLMTRAKLAGELNGGTTITRYLGANDKWLRVIDGSARGVPGRRLRQTLDPASGTDGVAATAVCEWADKVTPRRELWIEYDALFDPDFDWGGQYQGGKLPGIAGGSIPTGGKEYIDGFAARFMWRPEGKLVVYAYHQDRPSRFGEDFPCAFAFTRGQWARIRQRVVCNTGLDRNGEVHVWANGTKVLGKTGLRWRLDVPNGAGVDCLFYSVFHGGSSSLWAPSRVNTIDFDNFKVGPDAASLV